jgi:hypothetical protein
MRYREAHAATSGSVPFTPHGRKPVRTVLATAVAGAIGLVPAVMVASPALAATVSGDVTLTAPGPTAEGSVASFPLTLTNLLGPVPTDLKWSTENGTATAGQDYTAVTNGTVAFVAGNAILNVTTLVDNVYEGATAETFKVNVYDPTSSTPIASVTADITDTPGTAPVVTLAPITPATVTEGNNGWHSQTFTLTMTPASQAAQAVHWVAAAGAPGPGIATDGTDFKGANGDVTFASGETSKTFTVDINGDTTHEDLETFGIALTTITVPGTATPTTATVTASNTIIIADDDALPTYSVPNINVKAGADPSAAVVTVKLSNPTNLNVDFALTATDVTTAGTEYTLPTQTITIPAGSAAGYGVLLINPATAFGPTTTATITATPTGPNIAALATTTPASASLSIANGVAAPVITVGPNTVAPGGSVQLVATITGTTTAPIPVTFNFTGGSVNGSTAASPSDFTAPATTSVVIPAGVTSYAIGALSAATPSTPQPDKTILVSGVAFGGSATVQNSVITITSGGGTTPTEPGTGNLTISAPKNIVGAIAVPITGMAPASSTVDLWAAPMGSGGELKKILSTKSDADGNYSFSRWIGEGYRFAVASGEDQSDEIMVTVTQKPVFVASSPRKGVLSLAVQGNPRAPGQTVIVQRAAGGKWVNTWRGTTGSDNIWRGTASLRSGSVVTIRAFVAGYTPDGLAPGYTAPKNVAIK